MGGFAGSWLAEELLAHGYTVSGTTYGEEPDDHLAEIADHVTSYRLDITDPVRTAEVIHTARPNVIFHLAAIASVGDSFNAEQRTFAVNLTGTLNVLVAARRVTRLERLLFVSSPDCFGQFTPRNKVLAEDQLLNPVSPYGIAKAAAERAVRYFGTQHDLPVVVVRAFNHNGPRQTDRFAVPSFARQIAELESKRGRRVIRTGDLTARRDLSDVRDIVRGYRLAVERGEPGEVYHLCSGRAVAMGNVLSRLIKLATVPIEHQTDPSRLRKSDIPVLRGDGRKAARRLDYEPTIPLTQTLADTLQYWRDMLRR